MLRVVDRRAFLSFGLSLVATATGAMAPRAAFGQINRRSLALYANVGSSLTRYEVDVDRAELTARESVRVPAGVQYCWPDRDGHHLYVASSSGVPGHERAGNAHHVTAFRIDPASGALAQVGEPLPLPARPIHLTLDLESRHILVAFNNPSAIRVYRLNTDLTPGEEVPQGAINAGIYAHQVRMTPDGRHVVLVTRGNEGTREKPEDPGALMVFDYRAGRLSNQSVIAPNGGRAYGPRHLDFHPTQPWMYVCVETQNEMHMHRLEGGKPRPDVLFRQSTLRDPANTRSRQAASAVHVHPNGRFVYGANRAQDLVDVSDLNGRKVFKGGENSIVVFAIDARTGEHTPIQHIETGKLHPRTFHIDPSGRLLVAQHNLPVPVRDGDAIRIVPAGLSVFRIGPDGRLTLARTCDVEVGDSTMWWMGMVALQGRTTGSSVRLGDRK